jgi:hypothetical protein
MVDQLFLPFKIGGTPDEGDAFWSRESDTRPLLVFTFAP